MLDPIRIRIKRIRVRNPASMTYLESSILRSMESEVEWNSSPGIRRSDSHITCNTTAHPINSINSTLTFIQRLG